jgi:hypothetical protein
MGVLYFIVLFFGDVKKLPDRYSGFNPSIDAANPEIGLIFWDPNLVTCIWKIY